MSGLPKINQGSPDNKKNDSRNNIDCKNVYASMEIPNNFSKYS